MIGQIVWVNLYSHKSKQQQYRNRDRIDFRKIVMRMTLNDFLSLLNYKWMNKFIEFWFCIEFSLATLMCIVWIVYLFNKKSTRNDCRRTGACPCVCFCNKRCHISFHLFSYKQFKVIETQTTRTYKNNLIQSDKQKCWGTLEI